MNLPEPTAPPTTETPAPPPDRAALRERIAAAMREHWLCTVRDEADADGNLPCRCGGWREPGAEVDDENDWDSHLADAVLSVLPEAVGRAAVLREAAEALAALDPASAPLVGYHARGEDIGLLRRMADETQQPETQAHSCSNCEGVDPDTCFANPNRPPEQCPNSEFDGYGLQCQKPAGHNLCTFEEQQPAAGSAEEAQQ